jgi:hypothetical protein
MTKIYMAILLGMIIACGRQHKGDTGEPGAAGQDGTSCVVKQVDEGALVICKEGSVLIKNGTNGIDGQDGEDGKNGTSCTSEQLDTGAVITCGESTIVLSNGKDAAKPTNITCEKVKNQFNCTFNSEEN